MKQNILQTAFLFLFINFTSAVWAQDQIWLKYEMKNKHYIRNKSGVVKLGKEDILHAFVLKKGSRFLYYETPVASKQLLTETDDGGAVGFTSAPTDSVDRFCFRNTDSMFTLVRINRGGGVYMVNKYSMWKGDQVWKLLPESKKIGRFQCQRAQLFDDGDLVWDVWFTDAIPLEYNLSFLMDMPGLVVEATCTYPYATYELIECIENKEIKEEEIFPAVLNVKPNILSKSSVENGKLRRRALRREYSILPN